MKRVFDICFGCLAALILFMPVLPVAITVRLTSNGPALYWSDRVGRNMRLVRHGPTLLS